MSILSPLTILLRDQIIDSSLFVCVRVCFISYDG